MKFLNSDTVQSTIRVVLFMTAVGVVFNLMALPFILAIAIAASQDLTWVGPYVASLAVMSGAGILGKAVQKKYELLDKAKEYGGKITDYLDKERRM